MDAPSIVNSDAYSQDKAALDTKEKPVEQPDAFGSEGAYPQSFNMESRQDDLNIPPKQPRYGLFSFGKGGKRIVSEYWGGGGGQCMGGGASAKYVVSKKALLF